MSEASDLASLVAIDIDQRQTYLFETDKLGEMLGASRLMDQSVERFRGALNDAKLDPDQLFAPVSGELRAFCPRHQRDALLAATWTVREWLDGLGIRHTAAYAEIEMNRLTGTVEGGMRKVHHALDTALRRSKAAPRGHDAHPSCAQFVPCSIHGVDPANRFRPGTNPKEPRRELVSQRAAEKLRAWEGAKRDTEKGIYAAHLRNPVIDRVRELAGDSARIERIRRAITFSDLADRMDDDLGDRFIAFVCADGDGLGRLLQSIDWAWADWNDDRRPYQRNRDFAKEYDAAVRTAFGRAVAETALPEEKIDEILKSGDHEKIEIQLPQLPQLLGGDDLWMVAEKRVAIPLGVAFCREYEKQVENSPTLSRALELVGGGESAALTMSLGVAFAKAEYPAHSLVDAAEWLLASAKELRKGRAWLRSGHGGPFGCLDWHWIESSRSETVAENRANGWRYQDGNARLLLTSRPWAVGDADRMIAAATRFRGGVARRKREQLESILRRGLRPGRLAFEGWWKGLGPRERQTLREVMDDLPTWLRLDPLRAVGDEELPDPWKRLDQEDEVFVTPFLDLLSLEGVLSTDEVALTAGGETP